MSIAVGWPPPDPDADRHKQWVRDAWEALRPFGEGVYANFISKAPAASSTPTANASSDSKR